MKLLRNSGLALIAVLTIVMTSCGGGPIEHGTEYVVECPIDSDTADISAVVVVLENRLKEFGIEGDYELSRDANRIKVRVREGVVLDPSKMRNLLLSSADLKFRATYTMAEIAPTLNKVQETFIRTHQIDSANATADGLGQYIIWSQQEAEGVLLLCCLAKDTSAFMNILREDSIAALLPADVVFHWGKGILLENGEESIGLFACKEGRNYVMSGKYVESAEAKLNENNGSSYEISLAFNTAGTDEFARITKTNIGRSVAIEVDDFVYGYPTVNSEITGGKAVISGSFPEMEAQDLARLLSAGSLPVRCRMVEENTF